MNGIEKAVFEARDKLLDRSPDRPHPVDVLRALVDAVLLEAEKVVGPPSGAYQIGRDPLPYWSGPELVERLRALRAGNP